MEISESVRFDCSHVKLSCGCWIWTGANGSKGIPGHRYGALWKNGYAVHAHRWAYENFIGPIPEKALVCHRCDIPECVNPAHLWLGSVRENSHDMVKKGRAPDGITRRDGLPKNHARGDRHGWKTHPERLPRGEKAYWAKLTESDVLAIRALPYERGLFRRLAKQYGVSNVQIANIYRRKKWTHL